MVVQMTFRKASLTDLERLIALYAAFFREDGIATPEYTIRTNLNKMLADERASIFVAEENGQLVGISAATLTFGIEFGWTAELEDLYIIPSQRGHGLAKGLMSIALSWASDQGASDVFLVITPEAQLEQNLTRFYERLGFKDSRRITMFRDPKC